MSGEPFIESLGIVVVAAAACAGLARKAKIPTIVAYLLAGLAIGPGLHLVEHSPSLEVLSETGIALLLFVVGMELSFDKFKDVGKVALLAGLAQVALTTAGGFAMCQLFDFTPMEALFLAAAMTFSSTVVVVKLLVEKKELYSLHGRIAVGIFLIQDVVVILALTLLAGSASAEAAAGGASGRIAKAMLGMVVMLALVGTIARPLLAAPFRWAANAPGTVFIWSLAWCFGLVALAHQLNLSPAIGAFLAGIGLAQLPQNQDLRRRVHPLMNFFVAVFFVSLGLGMDVGAAMSHWQTVVALAIFVLLGKWLLFTGILLWLKQTRRTAFLTGLIVSQVSEFSIILVSKGQALGIIGPEVLPITTMTGLITICASSYLILKGDRLYEWLVVRGWLNKGERSQRDELMVTVSELRGHVIVVGMNTLGRNICLKLSELGDQVLAVDTDVKKLEGLPCPILLGNFESANVQEEAGLAHAKLLVSALHIEEANDLMAFRCHQLGIPCAIHVVDLSATENLLEMDATYLMIPKVDGVKLQNEVLRKMGFLQS